MGGEYKELIVDISKKEEVYKAADHIRETMGDVSITGLFSLFALNWKQWKCPWEAAASAVQSNAPLAAMCVLSVDNKTFVQDRNINKHPLTIKSAAHKTLITAQFSWFRNTALNCC